MVEKEREVEGMNNDTVKDFVKKVAEVIEGYNSLLDSIYDDIKYVYHAITKYVPEESPLRVTAEHIFKYASSIYKNTKYKLSDLISDSTKLIAVFTPTFSILQSLCYLLLVILACNSEFLLLDYRISEIDKLLKAFKDIKSAEDLKYRIEKLEEFRSEFESKYKEYLEFVKHLFEKVLKEKKFDPMVI